MGQTKYGWPDKAQPSMPTIDNLEDTIEYLTDVPGVSCAIGLIGVGGMGKTAFLDRVERAATNFGLEVKRCTGRARERSFAYGGLEGLLDYDTVDEFETLTDDARFRFALRKVLRLFDGEDATEILLVDDAQWLDGPSLEVITAVAERSPGTLRLLVAHRPVFDDRQLAALDGVLARDRALLSLTPLSLAEITARASLLLGQTLEPSFLEVILSETGGVPALVDLLVRGWEADGIFKESTPLERQRPPAGVVQYVGTATAQFDRTARLTLVVLTLFPAADEHLLADVTELDPDGVAKAMETLRSAGFLRLEDDALLPIIRRSMRSFMRSSDLVPVHLRLAGALAKHGGSGRREAVAEHLASAGATGRLAAQAYTEAGDVVRARAPARALRWYDLAVKAGAEEIGVAARKAEACALLGDRLAAMHLADEVVANPDAPDRIRALAAYAGALGSLGMWKRSVAYYRTLSDITNEGSSALFSLHSIPGLVASGEFADAATTLQTAGERLPKPAFSVVEVARLTASGLVLSVDGDPGEGCHELLQAADLLETGQQVGVVPDVAHAFAATLSWHMGDNQLVERLVERVEKNSVGGATALVRMRILYAWSLLRYGNWGRAAGVLEEVVGSNFALDARDKLMVAAVQVGLARRSKDRDRLLVATEDALNAILRQQCDLFTLDPVGEIVVAAVQLGMVHRVERLANDMFALLDLMDPPVVWGIWGEWHRVEMAVLQRNLPQVRRSAVLLEQATTDLKRLQCLAVAANAWGDVIEGTATLESVQKAVTALDRSGFSWEAARLAGDASVGMGEEGNRTLLATARELFRVLPSLEAVKDEDKDRAILSPREREIAAHLVQGMTYKQIGAQLYISPKTVEHHVASIRQKVGAGSRSEMLTMLRNMFSG